MDLFKPEDLERNSQVIVAGYGLTHDKDERKGERDLRFTRLNLFINKSQGLNQSIYYKTPHTKACSGMS